MAVKYIKKAAKTPETDDHKTQAAVQNILNDIAKRKEAALKELNKKYKQNNKDTDVLTFISTKKFKQLNKEIYCDVYKYKYWNSCRRK